MEKIPTNKIPIELSRAIDEYLTDNPDCKTMIDNAIQNGWLSDWKVGDSILTSISSHIMNKAFDETGAAKITSFDLTQFSPENAKLLKAAEEGVSGYEILSMNQTKTLTTAETDGEINILSPGQGGCTNLVIGGINTRGELVVSAMHYSPIEILELLSSIRSERESFIDCVEIRAVLFTQDTTNSAAIENSLQASYKTPVIESARTDGASDPDDLLKVHASQKTSVVSISMKGQDFTWDFADQNRV